MPSNSVLVSPSTSRQTPQTNQPTPALESPSTTTSTTSSVSSSRRSRSVPSPKHLKSGPVSSLKSTSTTSLNTTNSGERDAASEAVAQQARRNEEIAECILGMNLTRLEQMLDGEFAYHMAIYTLADREE